MTRPDDPRRDEPRDQYPPAPPAGEPPGGYYQQQPGQPPPYYGQGAPPQPYYQQQPPPRKRGKPVFLIVFLIVQALFIAWLIAGIAGASGTPEDCGGLTAEECNAAEAVGTGIGVSLILILWVVVDMLLVIPWMVYRVTRRR